jgi:uncharacterized membrane protein (UPF0136 family)
MAPASNTTSAPEGTPKLKAPEGNENVLQKAAAPLATLSSHSDPWPHYIMSGACGASAIYNYSNVNNPRLAAIKLAFAGAYLWAGRMLVTGNPTLGYDVGTFTSAGLLAVAYPRAQATSEAASVIMATLGGLSTVTNLIKSYEMRTGKPRELEYKRE